MVGQFAGSLLHPRFVRTGVATGEMNASSLQFHDEEQIESYQTTLGPDLHGGEIDRGHHGPLMAAALRS